jgi:hypothetical protein
MKKHYIYVRWLFNKPYVGRCCGYSPMEAVEKRAGKNGSGYMSNPKFMNAILLAENGFDDVRTEILCECKTIEDAIQAETDYIVKLDSVRNGYNCNYGEGDRNESILKLSGVPFEIKKRKQPKTKCENGSLVKLSEYCKEHNLFGKDIIDDVAITIFGISPSSLTHLQYEKSDPSGKRRSVDFYNRYHIKDYVRDEFIIEPLF